MSARIHGAIAFAAILTPWFARADVDKRSALFASIGWNDCCLSEFENADAICRFMTPFGFQH
jgi:hypothetical protein